MYSEKQATLKFTKEDNPIIESLNSKIEETRAALTKNIKSIELGLKATKNSAQTQLDYLETNVKSLPSAEYELLGYQREFSIKESLYLLLLQKKSDNAILLASTISDNMILDSPLSSKKPVSPKGTLAYGLALMLGLIFPMFFIIGKEVLDTKVKDKDDLARATDIPLVE